MLFICMFVSVNIESAIRANVILLEPRFEAINMKVMFASQKEYLVAIDISLKANGANPIRVLFDHSFNWYLLEYLLPYPKRLLDILVHVLIVELLEGIDVHALNRGILGIIGVSSSSPVLVLVVVFEYALPLIVPVNKVQVVLARRIHLHWLVFLYLNLR